MHGLIFETSVCYWQDQPDFYSSVPLGRPFGRGGGRTPPAAQRQLPQDGKQPNTTAKRGGFCALVHIGCSCVALRQSAQRPERATSKWISECSEWAGTRLPRAPPASSGPYHPLRGAPQENTDHTGGAHADHPALGTTFISGSPLWFSSGTALGSQGTRTRLEQTRLRTLNQSTSCSLQGCDGGARALTRTPPSQAIAIGCCRHCFHSWCQHERPAHRLHPGCGTS